MKMHRTSLWTAVGLMMTLSGLRAFAPPTPTVIAPVLAPYITVMNAAVQGSIVGTDPLPSGGGTGIKLASLQHGLTRPFDPATGLITGSRRHSPMVVVKQIDANTPKHYFSLVNNEVLSQIVIRFYGYVATNSVTNIFSYTLSNAKVVSIRNWQPNANDPAAAPYVHPEEISFVYEGITWKSDLDATTTSDTW
jgi:type VI secretion system secreted protein Hcp